MAAEVRPSTADLAQVYVLQEPSCGECRLGRYLEDGR
jgi:hypothetical protein